MTAFLKGDHVPLPSRYLLAADPARDGTVLRFDTATRSVDVLIGDTVELISVEEIQAAVARAIRHTDDWDGTS